MAKKEQSSLLSGPPVCSVGGTASDWSIVDVLMFERGLNGYSVQIRDETFSTAEKDVERCSVSVKVLSPDGADVIVEHIATETGLSQDIRTLSIRLDNIAKAALELAFATRPLALGETDEQK